MPTYHTDTPRLNRHIEHRWQPLERWAAGFFHQVPALAPPPGLLDKVLARLQADQCSQCANPCQLRRLAATSS